MSASSSLLFFARNCFLTVHSHTNVLQTHASSSSSFLLLAFFFFFSSFTFDCSAIRDVALFQMWEKLRIECTTQIWLRCRFTSLPYSLCSFFIYRESFAIQSHGLRRDEDIHDNHSLFFCAVFRIFLLPLFQFIIQNKTTKMPLLLIQKWKKKKSSIFLFYIHEKSWALRK